jgi:hypothetical protein
MANLQDLYNELEQDSRISQPDTFEKFQERLQDPAYIEKMNTVLPSLGYDLSQYEGLKKKEVSTEGFSQPSEQPSATGTETQAVTAEAQPSVQQDVNDDPIDPLRKVAALFKKKKKPNIGLNISTPFAYGYRDDKTGAYIFDTGDTVTKVDPLSKDYQDIQDNHDYQVLFKNEDDFREYVKLKSEGKEQEANKLIEFGDRIDVQLRNSGYLSAGKGKVVNKIRHDFNRIIGREKVSPTEQFKKIDYLSSGRTTQPFQEEKYKTVLGGEGVPEEILKEEEGKLKLVDVNSMSELERFKLSKASNKATREKLTQVLNDPNSTQQQKEDAQNKIKLLDENELVGEGENLYESPLDYSIRKASTLNAISDYKRLSPVYSNGKTSQGRNAYDIEIELNSINKDLENPDLSYDDKMAMLNKKQQLLDAQKSTYENAVNDYAEYLKQSGKEQEATLLLDKYNHYKEQTGNFQPIAIKNELSSGEQRDLMQIRATAIDVFDAYQTGKYRSISNSVNINAYNRMSSPIYASMSKEMDYLQGKGVLNPDLSINESVELSQEDKDSIMKLKLAQDQLSKIIEETGVNPDNIEELNHLAKNISAAEDFQSQMYYRDFEQQKLEDEQQKSKAKLRQQEIVDGNIITSAAAILGSAGEGFINTVTEIGKAPAILEKAVGETNYNIADTWFNSVSEFQRDVHDYMGDWGEIKELPPYMRFGIMTASNIGNMAGYAAMFATGSGAGSVLMGASIMPQMYDIGKDMGLDDDEAGIFSIISSVAMQQAGRIVPDEQLFASEYSRSAKRIIAEGIKSKSSFKQIMTNVINEIPQITTAASELMIKEGAEEISENVVTDVSKLITGTIIQKANVDDVFNPDDYISSFVGAATTVGIIDAVKMGKKRSALEQHILYSLTKNKDQYLESLNIDKATYDRISNELNKTESIERSLQTLPNYNNLGQSQKAEVLSNMYQAKILEEAIKNDKFGDSDPRIEQVKKLKEEAISLINTPKNTGYAEGMHELGSKGVVLDENGNISDIMWDSSISEEDRVKNKPLIEEIWNTSNNKKQTENAIQKSSTEKVLPREQGAITETGGERQGMGQGLEGKTTTQEGAKKEIIPGAKENVSGVEIIYPTEEEAKVRREFRSTTDYVQSTADRLDEVDVDEMKKELGNQNFGLLTAENPMAQPLTEEENVQLNQKAENWFKEKGYLFKKTTGKYGQAENSYFVPGLTKEDAQEFAKLFNQDSVAHSEGLIYQDGTMNPRVKENDDLSFEKDYDPNSDGVTIIKTKDGLKTFSLGYNFDERVEGVSQKKEAPAGKRLFNEANPETAEISSEYKKAKGIEYGPGKNITKVDTEKAMRIADAFEEMQDTPNDPEVQKAYQAMADETADQFEDIANKGYTVELWDGEGEPYANSEAMIKDLKENKHMYIFSTEQGFGEEPITEEQRQQNKLLQDSGYKDKNGNTLLYNDLFRFVHDFFGHSERGNGFGPVGEENAWDVHARMYTPLARRAMTTETRGQNSWVNFGPQMRNADGTLKKKGDEGFLSPKEREFAPQKMGLLPEEFSEISEDQNAEEMPDIEARDDSKELFDQATQKIYEIRDADGASVKRRLKAEREDLFKSNPRAKFVDDNFKAITDELEKQGLIKKQGDCP